MNICVFYVIRCFKITLKYWNVTNCFVSLADPKPQNEQNGESHKPPTPFEQAIVLTGTITSYVAMILSGFWNRTSPSDRQVR